MFVGQFEHQLDDKGRVVLPPSFRGSIADQGFVTRTGQRIGLWDRPNFDLVLERWRSEREQGLFSARVYRKLLAGVSQVRCDSAGRITLPKELLAGFVLGDKVVLAGLVSMVEIWPTELFHAEHSTEEADAEVSEALERLGY